MFFTSSWQPSSLERPGAQEGRVIVERLVCECVRHSGQALTILETMPELRSHRTLFQLLAGEPAHGEPATEGSARFVERGTAIVKNQICGSSDFFLIEIVVLRTYIPG